MLGLRLSDGISKEELSAVTSPVTAEKNIRTLTECGYLRITPNGFALTERGMYVSNSIINLFLA